MRHAKSRLLVMGDLHKAKVAEHSELQAKFDKVSAVSGCIGILICCLIVQVQQERDELYETFEERVLGVQKRSEAKNSVLEAMLEDYQTSNDTSVCNLLLFRIC